VHSQPLPAPLYKKLLNLTLKQKMIKVFLVLLIVVFATAATKNESSSLNRRLLSKSSRRNLGECQDNLRYKDSFGDSCEEYEGNKHWCGNYDTTNFKSDVHCCVCGGGKRKKVSWNIQENKYCQGWPNEKDDSRKHSSQAACYTACEKESTCIGCNFLCGNTERYWWQVGEDIGCVVVNSGCGSEIHFKE